MMEPHSSIGICVGRVWVCQIRFHDGDKAVCARNRCSLLVEVLHAHVFVARWGKVGPVLDLDALGAILCELGRSQVGFIEID